MVRTTVRKTANTPTQALADDANKTATQEGLARQLSTNVHYWVDLWELWKDGYISVTLIFFPMEYEF